MGKSASGKDSIFTKIKEVAKDNVKSVVIYTTRPKREGECEGREYHFCDEEKYMQDLNSGKMIEHRTYNTVFGPWHYYTLDDGQFDDEKNVIMIGTLEAYIDIKKYFGEERVIPIYVEVEDYTRLIRALGREKEQERPSYEEVCRRFVADCVDFSEENLISAGIKKRYINDDFDRCVEEIVKKICFSC